MQSLQLKEYETISSTEGRLSDLIIGFFNEESDGIPSLPKEEIPAVAEEDDEEEGGDSGDAEDTFTLPNSVTAAASLVGGGPDVVFDRIDGATATSGTVTLTGPGGGQRILTIFASGDAVASSALPPPLGTRVTDTRHAHLALPFSLNGSTTMTLTFSNSPNPDTVQAINVPSQISGGQFLWGGSVDVNGSAQQLILASHAIGVSTTDLSVTRDRTQNDKALVIDVDGTIIVSYTATGTLNGGVGVTVSIQ